MDWPVGNTPNIEAEAICHGDFHPLNILMIGDEVSGVLDWSGFRITDRSLDVAFTKIVGSIAAPILQPGSIYEGFVERYLLAYKTELPLIFERLRYFEALRCIMALMEGAEGQVAWRHPDVLTKILERLREHAGLNLKTPSYA